MFSYLASHMFTATLSNRFYSACETNVSEGPLFPVFGPQIYYGEQHYQRREIITHPAASPSQSNEWPPVKTYDSIIIPLPLLLMAHHAVLIEGPEQWVDLYESELCWLTSFLYGDFICRRDVQVGLWKAFVASVDLNAGKEKNKETKQRFHPSL